jgi:CheY-like chemotaxis protein
LRCAGTDDVDLALLDYDLGYGTDTLPIVALLTLRAIPFVFVTATSREQIRSQVPAAVIISKPVSQVALTDLLPSLTIHAATTEPSQADLRNSPG